MCSKATAALLVIPPSPPSPLHHHTTCSVMLCRLCSISCSHALTQPVCWRLARRMSSSGRARRWLTCTTYYPSTLFLRGSPTHLASHCHQCIRCEPKLHGPSTCRLRLAQEERKPNGSAHHRRSVPLDHRKPPEHVQCSAITRCCSPARCLPERPRHHSFEVPRAAPRFTADGHLNHGM